MLSPRHGRGIASGKLVLVMGLLLAAAALWLWSYPWYMAGYRLAAVGERANRDLARQNRDLSREVEDLERQVKVPRTPRELRRQRIERGVAEPGAIRLLGPGVGAGLK